ncbi:MAG: nuclear transport factor 2 family protein [Hyphomicrobiales bacterium]
MLLPVTGAYSHIPNERTTNMSNTETTIVTKADEAQSFAEYTAVAKALSPYIDAAKTGDGELSRTAFYDHANIVGSINGELSYPDADAFAKNVSKIGPSPDVQSRIVWIDIAGPAAAARVEFLNWSGLRFTDLFVLYKADGQWKISGKVYDSHANN